MRSLPILLSAALLTSCMSAPPQPYAPTPQAQAQLQRLIGGRVAGPGQTCISTFPTDRTTAIDERTIVFESGGAVYVNRVNGSCYGLGLSGYTMRINRFGGGSLCSNEMVEMIDSSTGNPVGSCSLGEFIPHRRM